MVVVRGGGGSRVTSEFDSTILSHKGIESGQQRALLQIQHNLARDVALAPRQKVRRDSSDLRHMMSIDRLITFVNQTLNNFALTFASKNWGIPGSTKMLSHCGWTEQKGCSINSE